MNPLLWLRRKLAPSVNIFEREIERLMRAIDSAEKNRRVTEQETKKQLDELRREVQKYGSVLEEQRKLDVYIAAQLDALRFEQYASRPDAGIKPFRKGEQVIVSLTSFPKRIDTVSRPIMDIMRQNVKPDRIILWLSKEQFPDGRNELPIELLDLERLGLEIRFVADDLKAHKKYFYAIKEFPDDIVITIDDDLSFDREAIAALLDGHERYPEAVVALRSHIVGVKEGKIMPYNDWLSEQGSTKSPSHLTFATTGAGTLYPPHCLPAEAFDAEAIKELCLDADDIWLKIMELIADTKVVLARPVRKMAILPYTQWCSLWNTNRSRNDEQLAAVLERYGEEKLLRKLCEE